MRFFCFIFVVLFWGSVQNAQAQEHSLEIYPVDGLINLLDRENGQSQSVIVDLDSYFTFQDQNGEIRADSRKMDQVSRNGLKFTILGSGGFIYTYNNNSLNKHCDYLCAAVEGEETCHMVQYTSYYQGKYHNQFKPDGHNQKLGEPYLAILGERDIKDYELISAKEVDQFPVLQNKETLAIFDIYSVYARNKKVDDFPIMSLTSVDWQKRAMGLKTSNNELQSENCTFQSYTQDIQVAQCGKGYGPHVLFLDQLPRAVSVADYNTPKLDILARFQLNDITHYVIRIGLKAQDGYGLLYKGQDGLWRMSIQPRQYPQLC